MTAIPWTRSINFASALLLHSCVTILLKEICNVITILLRFFPLWWRVLLRRSQDSARDQIKASVILDAYTSILSNDRDGELAELYFSNTGFVLLAVSLASSVAMNLSLPDLALNVIVASTFGLAWLISFVNSDKGLTLPILAVRRAGRFIWSDTPFVNFFTLIYIAIIRHGRADLRLQDYVTFRSIAVLELIFVKATLAASSPALQADLMRRLIESEWVIKGAVGLDPRPMSLTSQLMQTEQKPKHSYLNHSFPLAKRNDMVPFTTSQRLCVMLFKTSIGFRFGCLQGPLGPANCPLPEVGCYVDEPTLGWKMYRMSQDVMVIADCFDQSSPTNAWERFLTSAHGVLLRRIGRVRVIYLLRSKVPVGVQQKSLWHLNINLVTGVAKDWLNTNFERSQTRETCIIAGGGV